MRRTLKSSLPILMLVSLLGALAISPRQSLARPTAQNAAGIAVTVRAGFGDSGFYTIGDWFPVRVTLTNPAGGQNLRVRVQVSMLGESGAGSDKVGNYARDVDLPSPSRKEVTLYTYSIGFARQIDVQALQGETVIGHSSAALSPEQAQSDSIIGVISSDSALLNSYRGELVGHPDNPPLQNPYTSQQPNTSTGGQATPAHITLSDIPTLSVALDSLDALFVDDIDTGPLSAEQRDSITGWVSRGGMLVVTARPGGAAASTAFSDILPVALDNSAGSRSLDSLSNLAALVSIPITLTSPVEVPVSTLRTDTAPMMPASQSGVPLVVMRELGRGHVVYMALSPAMPPLKGWDGLTPLLRRIFAEHPLSLSYGAPNRSTTDPSTASIFNSFGNLFDLPGLQLPEPLLIAFFLFIYIILIGPINYIVLKRMRRTEWAWLTIPALVLVFSLGAYLIGLQSKGSDLVAIRADVLHTEPGVNSAYAQQFLGIFSPQRRSYTLQPASGSTVGELGTSGQSSQRPITVLASGANNAGGTTVEDVQLNTWSLRSFMSESTISAPSPLDADLHLGDNSIEGTVRNSSASGLLDVALLRGGESQYIGYLAPGQSAPVKLKLARSPFNIASPIELMPLPAGVTDPTANGPYYSYSGNTASDAQRAYNRRTELLSTALRPLLSDSLPANLDVIGLAWGPPAPARFAVQGYNARTEDITVWTSRFDVRGQSGQSVDAVAGAGNLPVSIYSPSNNPALIPPGQIRADPYADFTFRVPAGLVPRSLLLTYSLSSPARISALNVRTGAWDLLAAPGSSSQELKGSMPLTGPADYTGAAGDIAVRVEPGAGGGAPELTSSSIELALNAAP